ncbi:MAG: AEC family transporter [Dehalococcoidales bacterium]|nr:AEC family transporter [Dehalococcoidales bacterium]
MNILGITFQAVAALLAIGLLGFWIIGRKQVTANTLGFLSSLSIDIAVPCLTLASLIIDFSPEQNPDWWRMPLWWLGFAVVTLVLSLAFSFITKKEFRSEFTIGQFYQNGLFFPIIIIVGIFGSENPYLPMLFLFTFIHPTMMFSTYSLFFGKRTAEQPLSLKRLVNPVLVTTIIGLAIALIGLKPYIPEFIRTVLVMVGAMASPLFMLILGGTIYHDLKAGGQGERKFYIREIIKFVLVKNFVFPLVFLGLLLLIRPDYTLALIVILEAAVPPVTAIPIFAERSGGNRAISSQFVLGSFLVSIVSIPAVLLLFSRFFPFPPL